MRTLWLFCRCLEEEFALIALQKGRKGEFLR